MSDGNYAALCCFLVVLIVAAAVIVPRIVRRNAEAEAKRRREAEAAAAARAHEKYEASVPSLQFSVVHAPDEMIEAILANVGIEDRRSEAPLLETIYISHSQPNRLTITAGNRTVTHWNMLISADADQRTGGTSGTARLDRPRKNVLRWEGNVSEVFDKVRSVVHASDVNAKIEGDTSFHSG